MEYGEGKSPCPQVTAAPGPGLTLGSSRRSTRSAFHPLHHISPQINHKMIIPSRSSIRRRGSPHSPLVANQGLQKPHFSFYILLLFGFFFSPCLGSHGFTRVFAPERSVIAAACFRALTPSAALPPPFPWAWLGARGAGGSKHCPALPWAISNKKRLNKHWSCLKGGHGVGAKGFNHPLN